MYFITHWLMYLVAFGLGSLLTFFLAARFVPATSEHEAFADLDDAGYGAEYDSEGGAQA